MFPDTPTINQLSHVIVQAAVPAFLLGARATRVRWREVMRPCGTVY